MPEGNPLVAKAPTDGDGPGPLTAGNSEYGYAAGIGVAESAMDAFNGISNGDWIGGGLGVLSLAGELASAAIDPFGYLMSSVASFLMEHMQPLKDMLDAVAGDPPVIQSYSETWGNVAKKLEDTQVEFSNAVKNGTTGWTGEAADQYRKQAAEQAEAISGAATVAGAISTVVMIFGEIVAFVREFIRQLIADAVGKLIAWVMETVFSLGFGTPVVVAQAVTAIAKWAAKIADKLKELCDAMRRVSPLLGKLADVFEKIIKIFGKIAGKVTGLDVINTKNIKTGGFIQRGGSGGGSGGSGGGSGSGDGPDGDGSGSGSGSGDGSNGDGSGSGSGDSGSGSGDGSNGSTGSDGDSGGSGDSGGPSSTARGDGGGSSSTRDTGGSSPRSDGGSPDRTGDGSSTSDSGPGGDGSPGTARSDSGSPGDAGTPNRASDGGSPSPNRADTGGSPSHTPDGGSPAPHTRADTGGSPSHTPDSGSSAPHTRADGGSPAPNTRADTGGSPSHTPDAGSPAPHTRTDTGGSPSHTPDAGSPAPHTRADSGSPSHTPDAGSPAPHTRTDSGSPSHTGDGGGSPRTHGGDGGGSPTPRTDSSPGHHGGTDGGSPTRPTDSGTTTSGTAPTAPRLGDAGPSHMPSQRGGSSGDGSPGVPPQGQPMAGGMPPQGAPGGTPGGTPGSPGGRPQGGGWTGTPGSPRTPDTNAPRTPDTHTGPSRGPGQTGPGGRPNQPQPVARGNDFGPGAQPHTGTPGSHGPGNRPGGTGSGHTGPGGRGPGGHSGPPHSPDGHGPDGHGPRQDPDGSPHDRGPDGEPDRPLTPDEVNQRHSESTPAGSSYHRGDSDMGDLPHRVQPDPDGRYTVDVHVTPDGHARIGNRTYTPEEFADILRRNGDYDGRPIRLIGCDAGSNDFARRLSRELDTEVMAPSKPAWTDSNGRVFSSDYEIGPDGRPRPKIPPNGEWDVHSPDGTARRASDDGFTPDTSHADKQDVDADSSRSRGDGDDTSSRRDQPPPGADPDTTPPRQDPPPGADPDTGIPRDRNPHSVRQEAELLDDTRQQNIHRNPQHQTDFDPPTPPNVTPSRIGGPDPDTDIRPPARGERFPGEQQLGRNRAYEVYDDAGNRRGVYHTDGTGRVTHIDTHHPNEQPRVKKEDANGNVVYEPNPKYNPNPDVANPHPDTTYRVEIEGRHQTFSTDADGVPHPSVTFHRPDFVGDPVTVGSGHPHAPDPKASFASGGPYAPHTRYEVTDSAGVHRGTFYTDAQGHVRWADVESGRMMRTNPDIDANRKHGIGEGDPIVRQRLDPKAEVPHGAKNPERFRGNEQVDVTLRRGDSFLDSLPKDADGKPQLEPNKKYVVSSEYRNPGREMHTRSIYWTDEHGNVVVETYRPSSPDLNNPAPNVVYNVDGGKFVYHTGPEFDGGKVDTVRGRANDLELQEPDAAPNRDPSAQDTSNKQAVGTPGKYDGGHLFGKQFDSPGELLNMMAQWRPQNQGRKIAGPDHWHAFESDLASFLEKGGGKRKIEGMEVFPMRDGSQVPHTIQVRWIEVDELGNRNVHMRSFPNNPPASTT
ncbi:DNA/RNA non-specific endonuclease [Amycolatopsis keratiniphila]|uniref:DNA/RNA non-specific endonuclease n=1 Tax=Amycolatopsis keratiniphila subsp. keratiniphila TaxID=227715 RepID=A0A1W2LHT4_9PSEU|nr:DNA/RNA non-specific endonuclease [Amycolatopsis keratiniphila]ONF62418.1 hypothetical protein AVR91_0239385 [Amycolatopsis keratiniphila subsp. keratiniphila]